MAGAGIEATTGGEAAETGTDKGGEVAGAGTTGEATGVGVGAKRIGAGAADICGSIGGCVAGCCWEMAVCGGRTAGPVSARKDTSKNKIHPPATRHVHRRTVIFIIRIRMIETGGRFRSLTKVKDYFVYSSIES